MNGRIVLGGALLVAALASSWLLWNQRDRTQVGQAQAGRADYVLTNFQLVALDAQGKQSFTLRAPTLTRDANVKTMDIALPLFVIPPPAGSQATPWEVRSRTGWVAAKGEELRLRGDVRATSTGADGRPIRMATEQLNVFPKSKRATSEVAVTVTQPGLILNGRGLEAQLDAKHVILKSDVKARYESSAR